MKRQEQFLGACRSVWSGLKEDLRLGNRRKMLLCLPLFVVTFPLVILLVCWFVLGWIIDREGVS